jgi:hypothetical protein
MPHGEIVAACQFQDRVYIFFRSGEVYEMVLDQLTNQPSFRCIYKF